MPTIYPKEHPQPNKNNDEKHDNTASCATLFRSQTLGVQPLQHTVYENGTIRWLKPAELNIMPKNIKVITMILSCNYKRKKMVRSKSEKVVLR